VTSLPDQPPDFHDADGRLEPRSRYAKTATRATGVALGAPAVGSRGGTLRSRSLLFEGEAMANKDKGGSKNSKTAASKSLKEKRQAKKEKAARASSSSVSAGK